MLKQDLWLTTRTCPAVVAHADWGSHPRKRWLAIATRADAGSYVAQVPVPAGQPETVLERLLALAQGGSVVAAFDMPFGLPARYAARAGIHDYLAILPQLGAGLWRDFYEVAERPDEISVWRPFYPRRPGAASQRQLLDALGLDSIDDVRRRCDRAHADRRAGAPLFWTLGAQQVGKAAISGWRDMLGPAVRAGLDVAIWPFSGGLYETIQPGRVIVAETYPGECYNHLGIRLAGGGKRAQAARAAAAPALLAWAARVGVMLQPALQQAIEDGFGPSPDGEDPFDSTVGLFGTLNVTLGLRPPGEPDPHDRVVRRVEGWILGQRYLPT